MRNQAQNEELVEESPEIQLKLKALKVLEQRFRDLLVKHAMAVSDIYLAAAAVDAMEDDIANLRLRELKPQ